MVRSSSIIATVAIIAITSAATVHGLIGPSANPSPVAPYYFTQIQNEVNLMRTRWAQLDADCNPNAVFALTYLYMTNGFLTKLNQGYFDNGELLANVTLNFANRYSKAIDGFINNKILDVSLPWLDAFYYGATGLSSVGEDLSLAMNAHINYDLVHTVYNTRYGYAQFKTDYDRVNDLLVEMQPGVTDDLGTRYDAVMLTPEYQAANAYVTAALLGWRETAWQNAVLQLNSHSPFGRAALQASVLVETLAFANTVKTWNGGVSTVAARKAYCQANHGPSRI